MVTWWLALRMSAAALRFAGGGAVIRGRERRWTTGAPACGASAFIEALIASNSSLVILPVQDVFGWADRINTPATVNDQNWTWRMPWPNERLAFEPEAAAAVKRLREWSARYRGSRDFQDSHERS